MDAVIKKATFLRDVNQKTARGAQKLYRVDPPMEDERWDGTKRSYEFVVVSAVVVGFGEGPETYIFGADAEGKVVDFSDLPGSFKGDLDHEQALRNAGYEVTP
jgi:hypothetical protein